MKTCFYCGRNILNANRISKDDIRYVCKDEAEVVICNGITKKQEIVDIVAEFHK
jgi:hypothetical protein